MCNIVPKAYAFFSGLSLLYLKQLVYPEEKLLIYNSEMMVNVLLEHRLSESKSNYLIEIADIIEVDIEKMQQSFDHLIAILYLCLSIRVIDALGYIEIVAQLHKD